MKKKIQNFFFFPLRKREKKPSFPIKNQELTTPKKKKEKRKMKDRKKKKKNSITFLVDFLRPTSAYS